MAVNVLADQLKPLFIIQRSKNANEVHYDAHVKPDGKIDQQKPVMAYWIMSAKDGHRKELNAFDKKAYGFKSEFDKNKGVNRLIIKSFSRREIDVYQDKKGVRAEIVINGEAAFLKKIFINETEAIPFPKVHSIELFGIDKITGKKVYEKINT